MDGTHTTARLLGDAVQILILEKHNIPFHLLKDMTHCYLYIWIALLD